MLGNTLRLIRTSTDLRNRILRIYGFLLVFNVVAWGLALFAAQAYPILLPTAVLAYTFGLRHAVDADHIAAIDNTTRKLMQEGQRPVGVGLFFSLGHSTIVIALSVLIAISAGIVSDIPTFREIGSLIGTSVSAVFLLLIGLINLVVLIDIYRMFRRVSAGGSYDEESLEDFLNNRGLLARVFRPMLRMIRRSWHMYPLGVLFGLGFDTATEVALLFLAAGAAGAGLPWYAILCLPVLFAAGMSLLDTIDGSFMNFAYGWAFSKPVRKVFYNLTVTGLSVAVALVIGTIELLSIAVERLDLSGGFWGWVAGIDLNALGYVVFGLFVATWALALAVWRFGHIEDRWSPSRERV